jgi:putative membrane protein
MTSLLIRWLILTLAVVLAANIVPGFRIASAGTAFLAAIVLSLLNAVVRPVLLLLTLPINIVSLGLFTLVINALLIWATAGLLRGFSIAGFGAAFLGALVISVVSVVVNLLVRSERASR